MDEYEKLLAAAQADGMSPEQLRDLVLQARQRGYSDDEIKAKLSERFSVTAPTAGDGPDTSINLKNIARSAYQGATFNFGDELYGLLPGVDKQDVEEFRRNEKAFRQEHPIVDFAAGMAGGLVLPGGAAAKVGGKTLGVGQAVARGALFGAGAGALSGAGAGEDTSGRVEGAIGGALTGGVLGAAIPAIAGARQLAKQGGAGLSAEARAGRRLRHAIEKSGGVGAVTRELDDAVAAGRGNEVMLGDLTDRLRAEADFAANASDDVLVPLYDRVEARQRGATGRLLTDVRDEVGDPIAEDIADGLKRLRRNTSELLYDGLRAKYPQLKNPHGLAEVLQQPKVKGAWNEANKVVAFVGEKPDVGKPSFQQVFDVKQHLDDAIGAAKRQGRGNLMKRLISARDWLEKELETRVPEYRAVQADYRARSQVIKALETATDAWGADDTRRLERSFSNMDADSRNVFRQGLASELITRLRSVATNRDEAKRLIEASPAMQDKLRIVFGDDHTFQTFMRKAAVEAKMAKMRGPVSGSRTAARLAARGRVSDLTDVAVRAGSGTVGNVVSRGIRGTVGMGMNILNEKTANALGKVLMTTGKAGIRDALAASQRVPVARVSPLLTNRVPAAVGSELPRTLRGLLGLDDDELVSEEELYGR